MYQVGCTNLFLFPSITQFKCTGTCSVYNRYHFLGIEIIVRNFFDSFSTVMGWSFCYEDHVHSDIFIRSSKYV